VNSKLSGVLKEAEAGTRVQELCRRIKIKGSPIRKRNRGDWK